MPKWIGAALGLFAIAALATLWPPTDVEANSTVESSGGAHRFWSSASATGAIMGVGNDSLGTGGQRYLSVASLAGSVTGTQLVVWSASIVGGVDTLQVGGMSWSGYFNKGVDSLHVLTNGAGMAVTVNN